MNPASKSRGEKALEHFCIPGQITLESISTQLLCLLGTHLGPNTMRKHSCNAIQAADGALALSQPASWTKLGSTSAL